MKIKAYHWSTCEGLWMFYSAFKSEKEMKDHIKSKGYDPKFFKISN